MIRGEGKMQNLLNDEKINKFKGEQSIETELNAALNLAYYFTKKGNLQPDGLKMSMTVTTSCHPFSLIKTSRRGSTEDHLKTILMSHIEHLQQKSSIDQDAPLFPGYFGESGEKKLQRHISDYAIERDFNAVKKALRANQYQQQAQADDDFESRVKKIAQSTGRSERTIARSLGEAPAARISSRGQGKKLSDDDPRRLLADAGYGGSVARNSGAR